MKRYSFLVANRTLTLDLPGAGTSSKYIKLLEILTFFRFIVVSSIFSLLGFGLITSFLGENEFNMETSLFIFALILVILSAGLYTFEILSHISRRIVDPVGLFFVLIFGLITTASAVMVTPTNAENTFGSTGDDSIRALSGIGIMLSIALYYMVNTIYRKRKEVVNSYVYYAIGFTLFILTTLLFTRYSIENLDDSIRNQSQVLLLANLFSLPIITFALIKSKNVFSKLTFGIALFYSAYFLLSNSTNSSLFVYFLSAVIASLPLTIIFFYKYEKFISGLWSNSKLLSEKIYAVGSYIILFALFIFIAGSIFIFASDSGLAKAPIEGFTDGVDSTIATINNDNKTLFFGLGTSDASQDESTFVSILEGQGIFGTIGYALVLCYSIYLLFKTLIEKDNEFSKTTAFLYLLGFSMLFIPVVGIFEYVSIYGILLWWINFGLLTALSSIESNKDKISLYDFDVEKITILGKTLVSKQAVIVRLLIGLTLLIASFILIYSLLNLRGDLI